MNTEKEEPRKIVFSWADITCGHNCWYAKEQDCKCSCGGKNHGALLTGGEQPLRTSRIDGVLYYLEAADTFRRLILTAGRINAEHGWRARDASMGQEHVYHYHWRETDHGAPARMKPASRAQMAKWIELQGTEAMKDMYLLWARVDMPKQFSFCALGACAKCDESRAKLKL